MVLFPPRFSDNDELVKHTKYFFEVISAICTLSFLMLAWSNVPPYGNYTLLYCTCKCILELDFSFFYHGRISTSFRIPFLRLPQTHRRRPSWPRPELYE